MKTSLLARKIALIALSVIILIPVLLAVVAAASPSSSIESLDIDYKSELSLAHKYLDQACEIEVSLAKAKLTEHYSDKSKLTTDQLSALQAKAEGQNLSCRASFLQG